MRRAGHGGRRDDQLAPPFLVIATQNPIDYEGTYPLPEAQLDRFRCGSPSATRPLADEARMLAEHGADGPLEHLEPVAVGGDLRPRSTPTSACTSRTACNRYVVAMLRHTRGDPRLALGASPRAGIALLRVAKARRRCADAST